jgi:hypothetical protein
MVMEKFKNEFNDRSMMNKVVGLLLLIISLPLLVLIANYMVKDFSIWVLGQRTTARVVDLRVERIGDNQEGEISFKYYVDYAFVTSNGKQYSGSSSLGAMEWSGLKKGGSIQIKYFPLYPSHSRLDDSRYISFYICTYVPITFFVLAGFIAAVHLLKPQIRKK